MVLFAEISNPVTMLFIAAVALTTWLLLMRSHRYFLRQRGSAAYERPAETARQPRGHHLDAPAAAVDWEVHTYETAREFKAQIDSKMSALQALIADADRAAARLEAASRQAAALSPAPERPEARPVSQAESLRSPRGNGPPREPAQVPAAAGADRAAQDRRRDEVYTLADYGFSPADIAGRVGSPIGEVELILGLRGKQSP